MNQGSLLYFILKFFFFQRLASNFPTRLLPLKVCIYIYILQRENDLKLSLITLCRINIIEMISHPNFALMFVLFSLSGVGVLF